MVNYEQDLEINLGIDLKSGDAKPFQAGGKAREVGDRSLDLSDPVSALLNTCHWLLITCRTKYKPLA